MRTSLYKSTKTNRKLSDQEKFGSDRLHYTDREIQMEILYSNWSIQKATENTRANTSAMVWVMAVIIIITVAGWILMSLGTGPI